VGSAIRQGRGRRGELQRRREVRASGPRRGRRLRLRPEERSFRSRARSRRDSSGRQRAELSHVGTPGLHGATHSGARSLRCRPAHAPEPEPESTPRAIKTTQADRACAAPLRRMQTTLRRALAPGLSAGSYSFDARARPGRGHRPRARSPRSMSSDDAGLSERRSWRSTATRTTAKWRCCNRGARWCDRRSGLRRRPGNCCRARRCTSRSRGY
jgi:hypothetical protein